MFERTLQIIDKRTLEKMKSIKILLVGIGGVGGFALESLIRAGFQNITIIDADTIEESNLNRQIIANKNTIGKYKTEIAKKRALEINPDIKITSYNLFLNKENIDSIFKNSYDYIIDACDTMTTKCLLIEKALEKNCKIISCMGTGNRIDPRLLEITTLNKTYNDPLAKSMRSILKKRKISNKIPVIWSKELPIKTHNRTPGSIILVPSTAGILATYYILESLKKSI